MTKEKNNHVERKMTEDNEWALYNFIDKNEGLTVYQLAKKLKWTPEEVLHYVKRLVEEGLVIIKDEMVNERILKCYYPKPFKELLIEQTNWDEIKYLKKPKSVTRSS